MSVRQAKLSDVREIAEVHIASWQTAYRGMIPDSLLDNLSVDLREDFWKKIILDGMIALKKMEFSEVMLWVLQGNERARRLYEKTGFKTDGGEKVETWKDGTALREIRYCLSLKG